MFLQKGLGGWKDGEKVGTSEMGYTQTPRHTRQSCVKEVRHAPGVFSEDVRHAGAILEVHSY